MKNLKRVLCGALASVMLVGMMAVGASAVDYKDFTDKDEIQHKEAVETLVALNVIAGKDTGAYDPEGNLTRAEMAKLAVFVLHGGKDPVLGVKTTPTFSDIKGNWAESYIEYCASTGIINGQGDGTFNPAGTLTGSQAAKMVLTAMGYNADVFHFTGADWEINTNVEANKAKLYDKLEGMNPSAPITRDEAAQLIYNAIQAPMMVRSWSQDQTTGAITEVYTLSVDDNNVPNKTLLGDKFGGKINTAYLTKFDYDEAKQTWRYTFDAGNNFSSGALTHTNKLGSSQTIKSKVDYTDFYGQQVKLIWKNNDTLYGVYANESVVLEEGVSGDVGKIDTSANTVKICGNAYKAEDDMATSLQLVYLNNSGSTTAPQAQTLAQLRDDATAYRFKVIDNDGDGKIDCIVKTPLKIAKISYISADEITFTTPIGGSLKKDSTDIYEDYAKNDWVILTPSTYSATERDTVEKAELKTGSINGIRKTDRGASGNQFRVDGDWYDPADSAESTVPDVSMAINDEIEYVALGGYFFYAKVKEAAVTTKDICMVITNGVDGGISNVDSAADKARIIFTDGTKKVVGVAKLTKKDGTSLDGATLTSNLGSYIGKLMTYRVNSDGDYELTEIYYTDDDHQNTAGYKGVGSKAGYVDKKIGGRELADDAIVFVLKAADTPAPAATNNAKIYTGKELKNEFGTATGVTGQASSFTGETACLWSTVNGFNYAKVAVLWTTGDLTINQGSNYGYLTSNAYNTYENDKTYMNLKFWNGSEEVEYKWETTEFLTNYKSGVLITYDIKSDDEVKNVAPVNTTTGMVTGWDEDSTTRIELDGTSYEMNNDTVIMVVNSDTKKGVEGDIGSIDIAEDTNGDDIPDQDNVRYVLNSDSKKVIMILKDVRNNMLANPANFIPATADDENGLTNALKTDATEIKLGNNVTLAHDLTIPEGKKVTINANGKTFTITGKAINVGKNADLTLTAVPTEGGSGKVVMNEGSKLAIAGKKAPVTVKSGTVELTVSGGNTVWTIKGEVSIDSDVTSVSDTVNLSDSSAKLVVNGVWTLDGVTIAGNTTAKLIGTGSIKVVNSSATVAASTFYDKNGAAPTTDGGSDGTASTDLSTTLAASTEYAWGTIYTNTSGVTAKAWVKK